MAFTLLLKIDAEVQTSLLRRLRMHITGYVSSKSGCVGERDSSARHNVTLSFEVLHRPCVNNEIPGPPVFESSYSPDTEFIECATAGFLPWLGDGDTLGNASAEGRVTTMRVDTLSMKIFDAPSTAKDKQVARLIPT